METFVLIIAFASGSVELHGPFVTEAKCVIARDRMTLWAASLEPILQHISTCKPLSETRYTLEDLHDS
jgi:hypothetical protein